jgi:NAD(P)-dependent dehydrogenase (short-subunit alcohol dehydrogenase family)
VADDRRDPFSVEAHVVVVTGAGRGIGAAISAALTGAGARVHGVDLHFDATDHLHRASVCDVTDDESLAKLVAGIVEDDGRIDGLVNCAGISLQASQPHSRADFVQTLSVNTLAPFRLGWLVAQAMRPPGGSGGSIVNVTSLGAHLAFPENPSYQASKAALRQLTRAMALDLGEFGVRVNSLCPGYIATSMTSLSQDDAAARAARAERTILGRWGRPEDLAGPCQFLLSDASRYVTGIDLPVDGGWLAKGL